MQKSEDVSVNENIVIVVIEPELHRLLIRLFGPKMARVVFRIRMNEIVIHQRTDSRRDASCLAFPPVPFGRSCLSPAANTHRPGSPSRGAGRMVLPRHAAIGPG